MKRRLQAALTWAVAAASLAAPVSASAAPQAPSAGFEAPLNELLAHASSPGARKALVEAVLVDRRHRLADQAREAEAGIASLSAARNIAINDAKQALAQCVTLSDEQVIGYARRIIATETSNIDVNPAWKGLAASCPWYASEYPAARAMADVVNTQARIDRKAAVLQSIHDEAAAVEAQIAALDKAR